MVQESPAVLTFRRFAGLCALSSAPLAFGCLFLALKAVDFDLAALENPAGSVGVGAEGSELVRWSMILDLFGYYLLLTPGALVLDQRLRTRSPEWVRLFTLCGLGYILVGAIGAAILAAVWPPLIREYSAASGTDRFVVQTVFATLTYAVSGGLWNMLEVVLAGVWWVGIGLLVYRDWAAFGWASVVLGIACILDGLGNMLAMPMVASLGLNVYLVLAPLWALWLGVLILRTLDVMATLPADASPPLKR